ncbi:MAG: hypothetical protein HQ559_07295 [Lentisphaerae bacterium]|nr:hypothetical protein [Lentisphaerota bacterium]
MHPLAARTVRQAIAAGASLDPLEHFDDLKALDAAARRTSSTSAWREAELLDMPVIVGDIDRGTPAVLYAPSYAVVEWIEHCASQWFDTERVIYHVSIAWALAHGRDPEALHAAATPKACRKLAKKWAGRLNCGLSALFSASARLLQPEAATDPQKPSEAAQGQREPSRMRSVLARLCQEFSQEEDYWLFGPIDRLNAAIDLLHRQDEAEAQAISKASGKPEARDPDSPDVVAFNAWRKVSDAFLEKFAGSES